MATVYWTGSAAAVAQVVTCTVGGTIEATDIFIVTIGDKAVSVVGGSTVAATCATAIVTALQALDSTIYPEFAEITWADGTSGTFTATAATEGVPFTLTLTTTETGGGAADLQTFTQSTTVANSGPNDWATAENWSGGAVPVNTNDVIIEQSDVDILYGLAQSAVTLNSFTVKQSFTGTIGLPLYNANGYVEYRARYLAINATTVTIGDGDGEGSGRVNLDGGSVNTTIHVHNTGSPAETGLKAVCWKGTGAANAVNINKGSLDVAPYAAEVATIATLRVGYQTNVSGDSDVRLGSGCTLATIAQSGGMLDVAAAVTTIGLTDGQLTHRGGAITTLTIDGGKVDHRGTGTITTLIVGGGAEFTRAAEMQAVTVTNASLYEGAILRDPSKTIAFTNGIDLVRCAPGDVTLDIGTHQTLTPSAI